MSGINWKEYAIGYDKILMHLSFYQDLVKRHTDALKEKQTAVDIGAGTGNVAIPLAGQGTKVYALDTSPDMLSYLLKKAEGLDQAAENLYIGMQDANDLSFQDGYFDGASCMNVLYLPSVDPEKLLKEAYRVLDTDGTLALSSFKHDPDLKSFLTEGMKELGEKGLTGELQKEISIVAEVNKNHIFRTTAMKNTYSKGEIADLLTNTGFKVQAVEDVYLDQSFFAIATR